MKTLWYKFIIVRIILFIGMYKHVVIPFILIWENKEYIKYAMKRFTFIMFYRNF